MQRSRVEGIQARNDPESEPHDDDAQMGVSRQPRTKTKAAVLRLRQQKPGITTGQIAARLNIHPSTVRRHMNAHQTSTGTDTASNNATTDTDAITHIEASEAARNDSSSNCALARAPTRARTQIHMSTDARAQGVIGL
jgi:DNA-binding NarL/FixJ family response regulator